MDDLEFRATVGVLGAVVWIAFGMLGCWIADQKDRRAGEGFLLGLLLGPFGVLVEVLLPNGAGRARR